MSPPPCLYDTVIQSYVQLKSGFYGATLGRSCPPGVQLLPHFEVWSYRACQPLQMWQISHFCEIHSLSYEASKFFAMLSLCVFFCPYFAPGANIVPPIAYKSHSTPFPIRPHVLTPHSWLCDKNCGRSSAPKKKWNLEMANNTNVALPYMASTINKRTVEWFNKNQSWTWDYTMLSCIRTSFKPSKLLYTWHWQLLVLNSLDCALHYVLKCLLHEIRAVWR